MYVKWTSEKRGRRMNLTRTSRALRAAAVAVAAVLLAGPSAARAGADHAPDHGAMAHRSAQAQQLLAGAELIDTRQLYLARCGGCHGPRGRGGPEASVDFADPLALVRLTPEVIGASLDGGHVAALTTPLSAVERDRLTAFLRTYLMLPAPDADTERGRAVYARSCSVCHGDRGDAASWARNSLNPAPADFTAHTLEKLTRAQMIEAVTFGKENSAMMAFAVQLGPDEIAATVDYIRAAFMTAEPASAGATHEHGHEYGHEHAAADPDAPFPGGLIGDPARGRAFFDANCAECHGEKGDGQGRRAYFMITKPKNFLGREARAELDRPHLFEEIGEGVTGTTMPAWEKVLTPQQIADVAEYVYRAFLRPDDHAAKAPDWRPAAPAAALKKN